MQRTSTTLVAVAALALGGTTAALAGDRDRGDGGHRGDSGHERHHGGGKARVAIATLRDGEGDRVGRVWMRESRRGGPVQVVARAKGLTPGFHGFHIHETGRCDAPAFTSAGGHFNPTGADHGDHAGDLPSLLVMDDGSGVIATATDRFSIADLRDDDGSAVMIHSGRDNFANIPSRYGGPDAETRDTGDAGTRVACGVLR